MKQTIGGNGSDTTAAAFAYLTNPTNRQFRFADLYMIGNPADPTAILLTDWPTDLTWPYIGTFKSTVIKRGTVTMALGLEVQSLDVTWSPPVAAFGTSLVTANYYQKAFAGLYRNFNVRVWRCIMPEPGDANTYGAYELFGGRITTTEVSRAAIKFNVTSFLDCVNEQVPPNVIENTNVLASFLGAVPVFVDSETKVAQFNVIVPSSTDNILGACSAPSPGKIYDDNKLRFGYLYFNRGSTLAGFFAQVAQNTNFNAGGGVHYNQFITYQAFPFGPEPSDSFYVSAPAPNDSSEGTIGQNNFPFPYVPSPEAAV